MPNYCNYEMKIKGKKENIEKMYSFLKADYCYHRRKPESEKTPTECTADKHFFRVFECELLDNDAIKPPETFEEAVKLVSDDIYSIVVEGYCAWSVFSCMFEGPHTYYSDFVADMGKDNPNFKGITIPIASKELDLEIEIFSKEPGMGFMEHYVVDKGLTIIEDCIDYSEEYDEETDEYTESGGIEWNYTI